MLSLTDGLGGKSYFVEFQRREEIAQVMGISSQPYKVGNIAHFDFREFFDRDRRYFIRIEYC